MKRQSSDEITSSQTNLDSESIYIPQIEQTKLFEHYSNMTASFFLKNLSQVNTEASPD